MTVIVRSISRLYGLLGGPIMLVIGLGVLFLGLQWCASTQNKIAAMIPAEGRIVDVVSRTSTSNGKRKTYFYPVVEFRTVDGESIRFKSSRSLAAYRVGDTVKVLYDPQTPQSALIDSWEVWIPLGFLIGIGGIFALMGALALRDALAVLLKWGGLLGLLGIILLQRNAHSA